MPQGGAPPSKAKRRRRRRAILAAVIGCQCLALVALWLAFQRRPGWYRPIIPADTVVRQARSETTAAIEETGQLMVRGTTFRISLDEGKLNEWVAALPYLWPDEASRVFDTLHGLAVQVEDGRVRIGGLLERGGWRTVVHLAVRVELVHSASKVRIVLEDVRAGALPVPLMALEAAAARADRSISLGHGRKVKLEQLFTGAEIENRFVWPNGERPFRIQSISIEHNEIILDLEPL